MQRQQLFGALIVVVIIAGLFMYLRGGEKEEEIELGEEEKLRVEDVTRELSTQLGVSVSEDVERIALKDSRDEGATGLATRDYSDGSFKHTVLAALPDLTPGTSYQSWLVRGSEDEEDYSILSTGKLRKSKGGFLLEYSEARDLRDHSQVWVTLETKDDSKPETQVLEGRF